MESITAFLRGKVYSMSNEVLVGLLGAAIVLPLAISGISWLVEDQALEGTSLVWKIAFPLLLVVSIGVLMCAAAAGDARFNNATSDFDWYWAASFVSSAVSAFIMWGAYEKS